MILNEMTRKIISLALGILALVAVSCDRTPEIYKGYNKTSTGAYMKFVGPSGNGQSPRIGDGVSFEMTQYFNDTLRFTTADSEPIEIILEPAAFVGDIPDALQAMHVGDSAIVVILADSVFLALGDYDLKLLSIKPKEELLAEHRRALDSLRMEEMNYLEAIKADPNSETTQSGLIVMGSKGKGRTASMGEYVDFDFMMMSKDGDTLMDTYDHESMLMQYGEEFICEGFMEALGMTPQGSTMRFVVPSELGFDTVGYQGIFLPYDPIVLQLRMNEVMDKAAYEKKVADREAKEEAERKRQQAKEDEMMQRYLKENGIDAIRTESGMYIVREAEGTGSMAEWGDAVAVHYTMANLKGETVDSSYDLGESMRFTIGRGEMLPCIEEAVMTMSPGARVLLVSPSELGFGEFSVHETLLPSNSPLVIEMELVVIE